MAGASINEMITSLYDMVEDAFTMPLGNDRCILERDKVLDILDEIRANLPSDLKMAQEIVEKRNELIAAAKRECEAMKKQAEEYARQKTSEHEITQEARKKAAELVTAAERRAKDVMQAAGEYCEDAMKRTESAMAQSLEELRQSRMQFQQAAREQKES